jgi:hypothetical protein
MTQIPEQIRDCSLIRVCHPDGCKIDSHPSPCNHPGKRPVVSTNKTQPILEIRRWLEQGGNYGVVPQSDDNLLIVDADCPGAIQLIEQIMPDTFAVQSSPGSRHFYYRVPGYDNNQNWKTGEDEFASIRSDNWHTVGPGSTHPETGQEYQIKTNTDIAVITNSDVSELETAFSEAVDSREDGAAGGGGGGAAGSSRTASDLEIQPSQETLSVLGFINSDTLRQKIGKVIDHPDPPRKVRVWAGGWLHSAAGLTERQLRTLLEQQADWATDSGRIRTEVRSLVRESVDNSRAEESVNLDYYLSPGDMDGDTSESRKMESGDGSTGHQGGENKMSSQNDLDVDYTQKESLTVYKADSPQDAEDGDRVIRAEVTNMKGSDDNGPVDTDFVSISKGTLRDSGEFGVSPEFPQNSKSVGAASPDDLRLIAEALEQLADELE